MTMLANLGDGVVVTSLAARGETVFAGTSRGVWRVKGAAKVRVGAKEGLASEYVTAVLVDDDECVWALTREGLCQLPKDTFLGPEGEPKRVIPWDKGDGVRSFDVSSSSTPHAARTRDGHLWFATMRGLLMIRNPSTWPLLVPPQPRITRAEFDGVTYAQDNSSNASSPAEVPAGQGELVFAFSAPVVSLPNLVQFRHRLNGFETQWNSTGAAREVRYANIPPGSYRFEVEAMRKGQSESTKRSASFDLHLQFHFYQTWMFYFLLALASALTVLFAVQLRGWQVKKRFRAVLDERHRIARELHDTLAQVFAALGLAIDTATRELTTKHPEQAQVLKNARQLLAHARLASRQILANMRELPGRGPSLEQSLEDLASVFPNTKMMIDVKGAPFEMTSTAQNHLLRLAEEAVSNAVSHGKANHIFIEFQFNRPGCSLFVRDDGVGLPTHPGTEGLGIIGMRERAAALGGTFDVNSEPEAGTEVAVVIDRMPK